MVSSGDLMDQLRRYGLLPGDQLAQLPDLGREANHPRLLARNLVQRGWLTIYQANQLVAGKGGELVLGPYRILDHLGQGGLSQVFKARHSELDWTVALKVIRPEILDSSEGRRQFLLEMEAMARLDHPNIVQFCDVDQAGDTFYFAMEYVEGTDLGKFLRLSGPLPTAQACDFIHQTAMGLQHAHEHNLIHRDIKPVNLFVTYPTADYAPDCSKDRFGMGGRPVIKILDWGLASLCPPRPAGETAEKENPFKGILGTADYLAPEQARNPHLADIRSDIYSLGCTFYYLLLGRPPFPGGSLMEKVLQHQQADPEPVELFRPDVSAPVLAILKRMMAKRPEDRFQTPAAVALALGPHTRPKKTDFNQPPLHPKRIPPPHEHTLRPSSDTSFVT